MPRRLCLPLLAGLACLLLAAAAPAQTVDALCRDALWEDLPELKTWIERLRKAEDGDAHREVVRSMAAAAPRMASPQARYVVALHVLAHLPAEDPLLPEAAALAAPLSMAIARLPKPPPDEYGTSCMAGYARFHRAMVTAVALGGSEADKRELIRTAVDLAARTAINATHDGFIFEDIGIVIAARLIDREAYLDAMRTVADEDPLCPKPATALCGLTRTAELSISMGAQQVAIALLEDALPLAGQPGVDARTQLRARIAMARAQWRYGRPSLATAMVEQLDPAEVEQAGSLADFAEFHRLRAEMADAMLVPDAALDAFGRIVDRALKELRAAPEDDENPDRDALVDTAALLTARHVRRRFCLDCGEPAARPALDWLRVQDGERLSPRIAAENYLLHRLLPAEAAAPAALRALEAALAEALGRHWETLRQAARRRLPARADEASVRRAVALAVVLAGPPGDGGKTDRHDQVLRFLVETDLEAKDRQWDALIDLAWPEMAENGLAERHLDAMDDFARHLSTAGYLIAARAVLDRMTGYLPAEDDALVAQVQGRAGFWASVFARIAALAVHMKDWEAANEALGLGARIARTRLDAEWRAGPEQVGLLLRELKPSLRLIAQTRVAIATSPAAGEAAVAEARGKAFEELQLAMLGDTALGLQAAQRRRIAADPRLGAAIAARDRGLARLALLAAFDDTVGVLDRTSRATERRRIEAEIDEATRSIEAILPSRGALDSLLPLPIADARRLLLPSERLLVLHAGSDAVYGGLVAPDGEPVFWRVVIPATELDTRVQALRKGLDLKEGYSEFPLRAAHELYRRLFAPVEAQLREAASLLVVADGPLVAVPLAVLPRALPGILPRDMGEYRRAGIDWLGLSHAVAYLPTAGGLAVRGEARLASKAQLAFAGIGNPVLGEGSGTLRSVDYARLFKRGALADVGLLRQVESLPETEDEIRTLARLLTAADEHLFLRDRAAEPVIRRSSLERYRIIMFATHGVVGGELRGASEPGLVLTPPPVAAPEDDGLLTASEVLSLKLDADLVILSACNTASSDGRPRAEGFSGLTRAFLSAGARAVVATHWSIPSAPTVEVTTRMVDERRRNPGLAWSEALRRAFVQMVERAGAPDFAHPAAWAAFSVVGVEARVP